MKISKIMMFACTAAMAAVFLSFTAGAADDVAIDETNFPDETFRSYISENYDTDKNGALSAGEIENAEELLFEDSVYDEDDNPITPQLDLTGINYLKKLKVINILSRNVINADLSGIEALTDIGFSGGSVSGLVLGDMSSLGGCYIFNSDLTKLSLVDCPNLVQCYFDNNPKLAKIEVKNAENLRILGCRNDALESLNIENCAGLIDIDCSNNKLTKLDITNCPLLSTLNCKDNMIAELDISQFNYIIEALKNNNDTQGDEAPLTVDSSTKVIGYDAAENDSSESTQSTAESTVSSETQETNNNKTMLIIILAAVLVAVIAAAVIIVMVKGGKDDK